MKKKDFLEKWIECLPLNSKDQDRKEMSYDLDLLMAKGRSEQLKCQCTKTEKYYDPIGDVERCQKCEKAL